LRKVQYQNAASSHRCGMLWQVKNIHKSSLAADVLNCFYIYIYLFIYISLYNYIYIIIYIYVSHVSYNYIYIIIYICFSCFIPSSLKEVGPSRRLMRAISIASPGRSRWSHMESTSFTYTLSNPTTQESERLRKSLYDIIV
jgi:hypothetical protein